MTDTLMHKSSNMPLSSSILVGSFPAPLARAADRFENWEAVSLAWMISAVAKEAVGQAAKHA